MDAGFTVKSVILRPDVCTHQPSLLSPAPSSSHICVAVSHVSQPSSSSSSLPVARGPTDRCGTTGRGSCCDLVRDGVSNRTTAGVSLLNRRLTSQEVFHFVSVTSVRLSLDIHDPLNSSAAPPSGRKVSLQFMKKHLEK